MEKKIQQIRDDVDAIRSHKKFFTSMEDAKRSIRDGEVTIVLHKGTYYFIGKYNNRYIRVAGEVF